MYPQWGSEVERRNIAPKWGLSMQCNTYLVPLLGRGCLRRLPWRQGGSSRMCLITSVCFCAAENCWEMLSTALPKRPAWEIGKSRNRYLSASRISARFSQRWRSCTTSVDIVWPREHTVTFVARRARYVAVRSSCICPGLALTLVQLLKCLGLILSGEIPIRCYVPT